MVSRLLVFVCAVLAGTCALAQSPQGSLNRLDLLRRDPGSSITIGPIFSQLVMYSLPDDFKTIAPSGDRKGYLEQRAVLTKEDANRWTQMITVSGDEAQAFGKAWPQMLVDGLVARTKKNCPDSFGTLAIPASVGSFETAVAVAACGSVPGRAYSEATLQIVVKGGLDMYTFQWIVRGPVTKGPVKLDPAQWEDRVRRLAPIRLCRVVPGEPSPYPSCSNRA